MYLIRDRGLLFLCLILQSAKGFSLHGVPSSFFQVRSPHGAEINHEQLSVKVQPYEPHRITSSLRGGSQVQSDEIDGESKIQRVGMAAALAATYFSVMGAKCALPSVLPLLLAPETGLTFATSNIQPQQLMARLLTAATLAVALGKLLLGPLIDHLGGILSLKIALTLLAILLTVIASCQSFTIFAVSWVLVDFIFSSCWAGCINAIHQVFPPSQWTNRVGTLAAAARTGNAFAFSLFAAVLSWYQSKLRQPWRPVFVISACLQAVPLILFSLYGRPKDTPPASHRQQRDIRASIRMLQGEACTPEFWLHLISRSMLMVFASFLLFVPTLMSQVYKSTSALAAQTGYIYALGCLLSITAGSSLYSRLTRPRKVLVLISLLGMATFSSLAQLLHVAGIWSLSELGSVVSMFLWGFSFAIPFYIPPSLYALARGGKKSSATIADIFDIGGFGLLALFNGYVASITHATASSWIPTFQMTTACAIIALISVSMAVSLE